MKDQQMLPLSPIFEENITDKRLQFVMTLMLRSLLTNDCDFRETKNRMNTHKKTIANIVSSFYNHHFLNGSR